MNAWLLTWEGTLGPAVEPDRKILAFLSSRRASSSVEEIVDTLYCRSANSAYDMANQANKRKQRIAQYRHLGSMPNRFFYGRDPCIFARLVTDLVIDLYETDRKERIRWTDPAAFGNADSGSGLKEIYTSRTCEVVRYLQPLAFDIHNQKT
jgi:hypothetical protein